MGTYKVYFTIYNLYYKSITKQITSYNISMRNVSESDYLSWLTKNNTVLIVVTIFVPADILLTIDEQD